MPSSKYKPFRPPRPSGTAGTTGQGASGQFRTSRPIARSEPTKSDEQFDISSLEFEGAAATKAKWPAEPAHDSDSEDAFMTQAPSKKKNNNEPAIPPALLNCLVHNHFTHQDTRITKEAMSVLAKYVEVFTVEAIGRANQEREEAAAEASASGNMSIDQSFLEVQDLEKLAPQLLLDL